MDKEKLLPFLPLVIIGFLMLFIFILWIIFEPVTNKLEATCNGYGMTYVYRDGKNCLDKNNILHPIYTECPEPYKRGLCEIRFIKKGG